MSQKTDPPDSSSIAENRWRQGVILPNDILDSNDTIKSALRSMNRTGEVIGVVVSQDCDVVHPSFDTEPLVEILLGKVVDKKDFKYQCTGCQSPRKLHMRIAPLDSNTTETCIEFHANDRIRIDRKLLCDCKPNQSLKLSSDSIETIRHWIVLRYSRPAFPDTFNDRIRDKSDKIKKLLKEESSSYLSCIYLLLLPDAELPPTDAYKVRIASCMREKHYQDLAKRIEAEKLLDNLEETLDSCSGIEIIGSSCDSETALSLHDIRSLKRWSAYDHITIRKSSADNIPL